MMYERLIIDIDFIIMDNLKMKRARTTATKKQQRGGNYKVLILGYERVAYVLFP